MNQKGDNFKVQYYGVDVSITTYREKGHLVYQVSIPNKDILFITKSVNLDNGNEFWTSVPEGKLALAGEIGKLIDQRPTKQQQLDQNTLF